MNWLVRLKERLKGDYMTVYITFFPVGNGDMTLIQTITDKYIMIDCNIRNTDDNDNYDANKYLLDNLPKDNGVSYVDAFFLTHSDNDHCRNVRNCFSLCSPDEIEDDRIRIDELCVPALLMVNDEHYNDDADAIREEAQRRLDLLGSDDADLPGNRVKIIGYSDDLKEYSEVIVPAGENVKQINGSNDYGATFFVLRPIKRDTDDENTDVNDCTASFLISFEINTNTYHVIIGGDLVCANWKEVIELNPELTFDLLLAPHHCSWKAVSEDEDAKTGSVDEMIEEFLEQSKDNNPYVVSSSKHIKRDSDNPPSYRAMNVYKKHLHNDDMFLCTADYPTEDDPKPLKLKITGQGLSLEPVVSAKKKSNSFTQKSYGMV